MSHEFVDRATEASDMLARDIAISDATEKMAYATVSEDQALWAEAVLDMRRAEEMPVRRTEESHNRVLAILIKNDPIRAHLAGFITYEQCRAAVEDPQTNLALHDRIWQEQGMTVDELIAKNKSFALNEELPGS